MMVARDPAIKLFGKEIPLPKKDRTLAFSGENSAGDCGHVGHDRTLVMATCLENKKGSGRGDREQEEEEENETEADHKYPLAEKPTGSKQEDKSKSSTTEEPENQETLPESDQNPKTPSSGDKETGTENSPKNENDQSDSNYPQQTPLKKPDKILPCPRCNSMDTKFCYYNNYNVNQPRHFCKSCQRYWTAGGTMRNVPVGAGRRKNKNSTLHCRHITISEALQAARIEASNGIHHPAFKTNGTVLSFGPEAPIFESVAAVLNPAEKKAPNGILNGFYKVEQGVTVACNGGEKGDDCSSGSSVTTLNSTDEGVKNGLQERFSSQIPCLPGIPWPYPWNSAIPVPAFCPSGIPVPFYPAPYWNCSVPGAWSVPWLSPPSLNTNQTPPSSAANLTTLGKHSRDGDLLIPSNPDEKRPLEHKNSERSILIPKTLRIDDPDEAARSSIWTTLGIKNDSISRRDFFKAFQAKGEEKNHIAETHSPLQTNPAALSRSLSFQETA